MKKFFIFISAAVVLAVFSLSHSGALQTANPQTDFSDLDFYKKTNLVSAYAAATEYGLIGEGAILLDEDLAPLTGLPATYFVILISASETHYRVRYNDLTGYIDKNKIVPIDYEPKLVFGTAYFIANNDTHPVNVRVRPESGADVIATIPDGESAFYYGAVAGDALITAAGNLWYYVRLSGNQWGYVYSAQGIAGTLPVNSGQRVDTATQNNDGESGEGGGTSFPDWAFILLLAVPAVIITLALFARKPSKEDKTAAK